MFEQLKNKFLAKKMFNPSILQLIDLDVKFLRAQYKFSCRKIDTYIPSPTHLEVKEDALIAKKVDFDWLAIHLPIIVFPVPGGPNNSKPYKQLNQL